MLLKLKRKSSAEFTELLSPAAQNYGVSSLHNLVV